MKWFALVLLLLPVSLCAQQVQVVQPNGETVPYVKQKARTVYVHDTINHVVFVHDTVRMLTFVREIREPYSMNVAVAMPERRDTVVIDTRSKSELGVFGFSTFLFNLIGPSYAFTLGPFRIYITAGVSYLSEPRRVIANAGIAGFAPF